MSARAFCIGLAVTALVFFIGACAAVRFMDTGPALLVGLATWASAAAAFASGMTSAGRARGNR